MCNQIRGRCWCLILLLSYFIGNAATADEFIVKFIDSTTNQPLANISVIAKQREADGSLSWKQRKTTNDIGEAEFNLDFTEGPNYLFELKAFNNFKAQLGNVSQPAYTEILVGKQVLSVLDGTQSSQPALANHSVKVEQYQIDGSTSTVATLVTDDKGQLKLDLPAGNYRLKARTLVAQRWVYSEDFDDSTNIDFAVGEPPLKLTVKHAQTGVAIGSQQITARRIGTDGNTWYGRKNTDENGLLVWEMNGLNKGDQFLLSTNLFDTIDSQKVIATAGEQTWSIGNIKVSLQDGTQAGSNALADHQVYLKRVQADGNKHVRTLTSDSNGELLFDLLDISPAQPYLLQAKSPTDGSTTYSQQITSAGTHEFSVGSTPLSVTLKHAQTSAVLADTQVVIKQVNSDASTEWLSRVTTDSSGQLSVDLPELGKGQQVQLSVKAFHNVWSYSNIYSEAGEYDWNLGSIQVQLTDGSQQDTPVLAGHRLQFLYQNGDSLKVAKQMDSDDAGMVLADLNDISESKPYLLRALSPLDGSTKYQKWITSLGQYELIVGSTPLSVTVTNAQTDAPLADISVTLRSPNDEGGTDWVTRKTTDANGQFSVDLPELGSTQSIQLSAKVFNNNTSYSKIIEQPGQFEWQLGALKLTLTDGTATENSVLANHRVDFLKQEGDSLTTVERLNTDDNGQILVDLLDISENTPYLVRARSAADTSSYYEMWVNSNGDHNFVVGSAPVNVTLTHARTSQALSDRRIWLRKWNEQEQHYDRVKSATTDELGQLSFDIADLDGNNTYLLEVNGIDNFSFYSDSFTQAGDIHLSAGKVQVQVKDGSQTEQPSLANTRVYIKRYNATTDTYSSHASATTNEHGLLELDLPELDASEEYVLMAKSLTDQKYKYSGAIGTQGDFEFVVGNPAVTVQLTDLVSNSVLSDVWVSAQKQDQTQSWSTFKNVRSDENGQAVFDLAGITEAQEYRFKVSRYHGAVFSEVINSPGEVDIQLGALPVTLSERDTGNALAGVRVIAYEYSNGELSYQAAGNTDANGLVVFDLAELGASTYILKANKPFDGVSRIFSPFIHDAGAFDFIIAEGDDTGIDTQAPGIQIYAPESDQVASQGFILSGAAEDDKQLDKVVIQVWDSLGNINEFSVTPANTGTWSGLIPAQWLTVDTQIGVAATAYDRMGNSATANRQFSVVEDTTAPQIIILSHQNNESVSQSGFSVSGAATDNIQVQSLTVNVADIELGAIVSEQNVAIDSQTGHWAFYLNSAQLSNASQLAFTFNVADSSGNTASADLELLPQAISPAIQQLIQRATFGPTPTLEASITQMGAQNWIEQQLSPDSIDDSEVEAMVSQLEIERLDDLRERELIYQIYSQRQLQQVMAWFWENHFSTDYNSHRRVAYEEQENRLFREHALGNFRQLLEISAKSPAMLIYLDNVSSRAGYLNENYPRELMELHTMGVDGGYSADDIIELARILTGWRVVNGEFEFSASRHDDENKFFLGEQVIGGGIEEGEAVLTRLSQHPSTASFICAKLVEFWIGEDQYPTLQSSCAASFIATEGDIPSLLRVIFSSAEFNDNQTIASKVKTPLEMYVSAIRATQATPDLADGIDILEDLGMALFEYPAPDGFGDEGADWINVDAMIQRTKFALRLAFEDDGGEVELLSQLDEQGIRSGEAIVDYLFNLMLTSTNEDLERQQALSILNQDSEFSIDANDAQQKLQRLLATILSYPGFQYQ